MAFALALNLKNAALLIVISAAPYLSAVTLLTAALPAAS
jgi:hypothetical protein